jgi:hypothetical protein
MKFIVIYYFSTAGALLKEQFDTHKSALKFIKEIVEPEESYELMYLIHGAFLETGG